MIASLAFLTSPSPGVYLLNVTDAAGVFQRIEISKAQLGGIVVDGASMALRANDLDTTLHNFLDNRGTP